jgi:hypothetical protein
MKLITYLYDFEKMDIYILQALISFERYKQYVYKIEVNVALCSHYQFVFSKTSLMGILQWSGSFYLA